MPGRKVVNFMKKLGFQAVTVKTKLLKGETKEQCMARAQKILERKSGRMKFPASFPWRTNKSKTE